MRGISIVSGLFLMILAGCGGQALAENQEPAVTTTLARVEAAEEAPSSEVISTTTTTVPVATTTVPVTPTTQGQATPTTTTPEATTTTRAEEAADQPNRPPVIEDPGVTADGLTVSVEPVVVDPDGDAVEIKVSIDGVEVPIEDGIAVTMFELRSDIYQRDNIFEPHSVLVEVSATDSNNALTAVQIAQELQAETLEIRIGGGYLRFDQAPACFGAFTSGGWTPIDRALDLMFGRRLFGIRPPGGIHRAQIDRDSLEDGIYWFQDLHSEVVSIVKLREWEPMYVEFDASLDGFGATGVYEMPLGLPVHGFMAEWDVFEGSLCESVLGLRITTIPR